MKIRRGTRRTGKEGPTVCKSEHAKSGPPRVYTLPPARQSRQKDSSYLTTEAAVRRLTIVPSTSTASWVLDVFELGSLRLPPFAARLAPLA